MSRGAKLVLCARLAVPVILALAVGGLVGCRPAGGSQAGARDALVVRGSDTMVNLVAAWAEAFMAANSQFQVSVQGGGSSTGFAALVGDSTDLANASRPIKDSEVTALLEKGKTPVEHVVAFDAVVIIVNAANPLVRLTLPQLSDIFTGKTVNWKAVGGPDREITIYSRESSSGTFAFVQEHVMGKADFVASARLMPSSESILQAVTQDKTAIGYVSLGYVTSAIKSVAVAKSTETEAVIPSVATVLDQTYPISRSLFIYSAGPPGFVAEQFITFCTSRAGGGIAEELGFVPVR